MPPEMPDDIIAFPDTPLIFNDFLETPHDQRVLPHIVLQLRLTLPESVVIPACGHDGRYGNPSMIYLHLPDFAGRVVDNQPSLELNTAPWEFVGIVVQPPNKVRKFVLPARKVGPPVVGHVDAPHPILSLVANGQLIGLAERTSGNGQNESSPG